MYACSQSSSIKLVSQPSKTYIIYEHPWQEYSTTYLDFWNLHPHFFPAALGEPGVMRVTYDSTLVTYTCQNVKHTAAGVGCFVGLKVKQCTPMRTSITHLAAQALSSQLALPGHGTLFDLERIHFGWCCSSGGRLLPSQRNHQAHLQSIEGLTCM